MGRVRAAGSAAHPVGLVDDEHAQLAQRGGGVARAQVVDEPARRAHHHVRPLRRRERLPHHVVPAPIVATCITHPRAERADLVGDLRGELRAGERITPKTPYGSHESACSIGSTNAAVLPEPVSAEPSTSRPASAGRMQAAWMGVGRRSPSSLQE